MKRLFGALALGCLLVGVTVRPVEAQTKTGEAKFTGPKNEAIKVSVGDKLKLDATYQQIDVGGLSAVSVQAMVSNTTKAKMHFSYNVAFLDKDKNLIGCHNSFLFVDGGKQLPVGTFIQLPPDQIARIAYYSVAFYESDKPIGSK